jgi:hypothetical protein
MTLVGLTVTETNGVTSAQAEKIFIVVVDPGNTRENGLRIVRVDMK